jgi:hypothetical protein
MEDPLPKDEISPEQIPANLASFFWDVDFPSLSWDGDRDFIIRRVLQMGSWEAVKWLRGTLGDTALRRWIERRGGGGLSARQLRFWGLVLGLPDDQVTEWVEAARNTTWEQRITK